MRGIRHSVGPVTRVAAAVGLLAGLALWGPELHGQTASTVATAEPGEPIATGSGPLEAVIEAQTLRIEQRPDGTESRSWRKASRLSAGDEVYYTIRVRNPGKRPVTGIVVTKRLPFGVTYIRGSATGPACEVLLSQDDGATFLPAGSSTAGTAGKSAAKKQAAEYTHVRWILGMPLEPAATALLRFRATFT